MLLEVSLYSMEISGDPQHEVLSSAASMYAEVVQSSKKSILDLRVNYSNIWPKQIEIKKLSLFKWEEDSVWVSSNNCKKLF